MPLGPGPRRAATRGGRLFLLLLALWLAPASAQDAARGRALYSDICARCHSDPPGSGAINPLVRTADQIRAALDHVSPMRSLGDALSGADLASIAAYFVTVLGPPADVPDFDVGGQWASSAQPWWTLYVTQHPSRVALSGGWLTFDVNGAAVWLYFHEAGGWTGPGIYTATLFRNTGPPFATPPGPGTDPPKAAQVGTIALVFTDRDNADVTFTLECVRVAHRIGRVATNP
jgi:hypothetical protein